MDSLALWFGKAICQSSTRLEKDDEGEQRVRLRCTATSRMALGGAMGPSVSVNGVPVPSPTLSFSGSSGPGQAYPMDLRAGWGGWTSKVNSHGGSRDGGSLLDSGHCAATLVQ